MVKDRSFGDRGTGYTPRVEGKIGRGSRWCKRCGDYTAVIQKYDLYYVDVVLERLQFL